MDTEHVLFVVIGVIIVFVVGRLLVESGRKYLANSAPSERSSAGSAATLVAILFHLLTLGIVALIAVVPLGSSPQQTFLLQIGILLIVLAAIYGITLALLSRRREEALVAEVESHRGAVPGPNTTLRVQPRAVYDNPPDNEPMDPRSGTATGPPDQDRSM